MIGGILGDYFGSIYEGKPNPNYDQVIGGPECTITDETVLLCATAESMMKGTSFSDTYRKWAAQFPDVGYGPGFSSWLSNSDSAGESLGNGAASRCGVLGYLPNEDDVLRLAEQSAICSHQHLEAINGAKAVAWTIWAVRRQFSFDDIKKNLYSNYNYALYYDLEVLSGSMGLDSTADNTVPIALWVGLNADNTTDCLRQCFHIGGDTDSIASIACLVNQQRCRVESRLSDEAKKYLRFNAPSILQICEDFSKQFPDIGLI